MHTFVCFAECHHRLLCSGRTGTLEVWLSLSLVYIRLDWQGASPVAAEKSPNLHTREVAPFPLHAGWLSNIQTPKRLLYEQTVPP